MACCLMAPSQCLNWFCLLINKIIGNTFHYIFTRMVLYTCSILTKEYWKSQFQMIMSWIGICLKWISVIIVLVGSSYVCLYMCKMHWRPCYVISPGLYPHSAWHHKTFQILVNAGSGHDLLPDGTKPLLGGMLTYPQWGPVTFIWLQSTWCQKTDH